MANTIITDLCQGEVLQANPLATVTRDFVIVGDAEGHSHTIIALVHLSGMKRITTTYPALLVASSGLLLISAAAFCSREGSGAGPPIALLAAACAVGYLLSRKAAVAFLVGSQVTETIAGSPGEAAALIKAVQSAQERIPS